MAGAIGEIEKVLTGMIMRLGRLFLVAALLSFVAAGSALADSNYDFSFSGSGITSAGVLTGSPAGIDFSATKIVGLFDGSSITGLLIAGTYQSNDNLFYPGIPSLDFSGISFSVGSLNYNVFYDNGHNGCESKAGFYVYTGQSATSTACGPRVDTPVSFNLTAVAAPEPATPGLLLLGMGLLFVMRKRFPLDFSAR